FDAPLTLAVNCCVKVTPTSTGLLFGVSDTETGPPPPPVPPLAQLTSKLRPNSMSNNSSFFIHLLHASTHLEESTLRTTKSSHIVTPTRCAALLAGIVIVTILSANNKPYVRRCSPRSKLMRAATGRQSIDFGRS